MAHVRLDTSDPVRNPGWNLSFQGSERIIRCDAQSGETTSRADYVTFSHGDAIEGLRHLENQARSRDGRWVGFLSYDLSATLQNDSSRTDATLPLYAFTFVPATSTRPLMPPAPVEHARVE